MDEINIPLDLIKNLEKQPPSKETILSSARLVKGIVEGTMYQDEFYKDDDVTPKTPTNEAIQQHLDILNNNLNFLKYNEKYLDGVALNDDEDSIINFSKSETVENFLKNGKSNWDNYGGGIKKELFSNLQLRVPLDMFIFIFTVDSTSMDYADYIELQVNNNEIGKEQTKEEGKLSVYTYGESRDGNQINSPIHLNYGLNDFMIGTKLTVVVYSANGESASIEYNI
jgi:hypothetical protein